MSLQDESSRIAATIMERFPAPLMVVFRLPGKPCQHVAQEMHEMWRTIWNGEPPCPLIIVPPDVRVELVAATPKRVQIDDGGEHQGRIGTVIQATTEPGRLVGEVALWYVLRFDSGDFFRVEARLCKSCSS